MKIPIQKTAKVATYGTIETAKYCWIVLHGYGQLVDYFIRKFHVLNENDHFIIAPEGFHRFYLKGTSGRVGASWMTKEERLDDIDDNILYLNQVVETIVGNRQFEKMIVLGFSQGASTAARWIQLGALQPDVFVQWAGVFPPDLEIPSAGNRFESMKHVVVIGNQDPYFKHIDEVLVREQIQSITLNPTILRYEGEHAITDDALLQVTDKLGC
jgi:predicted esterase